ncbi:MAG: indolepyruvate ferredoxin oxidoreductase subunit alpha [Pseudomonadota bacterium]
MNHRELMLGNEAIARGIVESGCEIATAYPGTPSTEILSSLTRWVKKERASLFLQWAVNEKVAFEIAYAGSQAGKRTAVAMKQVGLNVASDPLMSAAYMGCKGGFVVISADDPGPHSSQTEQDSRLMAMMAKVPVLDPDSPRHALELTKTAFELSESFEIPVILRPTTRVCHARQDVEAGEMAAFDRPADFKKDASRWAATPKFRTKLHYELEEKLVRIAACEKTRPIRGNPGVKSKKAVISSGVAAANTRDLLEELGLWDKVTFYQVVQPYPLHTGFMAEVLDAHEEILVIEETTGVIEMQLARRDRVKGKLEGTVPRVGELLPETIERILRPFAGLTGAPSPAGKEAPGRRPTLCAGCPHRASFYAIKKAAPKGIFTSDIGCYTLGLNLGAVDTVLCMGASISQAAGFSHAYRNAAKKPDIIATIGDSTFFHAGIPALIDTVVQQVPYVLVILDNRTTAMTGNQPTPATGAGVSGEPLASVDIAAVVKGCGVTWCKEASPYALAAFIGTVKEAIAHSRENGPAVIISRFPCILSMTPKEKAAFAKTVRITDTCDGCGYCIQHFECPALVLNPEKDRVMIDPLVCSGCGVCVSVCPKGSIETAE